MELWRPPLIWQGQTAFILGGGPSLADFDGCRLAGRNVIACNSSYKKAPGTSTILLFVDYTWAIEHIDAVKSWDGLVVSTWQYQCDPMPGNVKYLSVRSEKNTGAVAINLAMDLGATKIVLLGFDMRIVDGRANWHDDYPPTDAAFKGARDIYSAQFIPHFAGWREQADARGVEIVNATPGSALKEFPMVTIEDVLFEIR